MLKKENRLNSKTVLVVLKRGRKIQAKGLMISYFTNSASVLRCAFVISRRVDTRATERNKIKRRLSAVWQEFMANRKIKSIEMVVLVKPAKGPININELADNLRNVLEKL